MSNIIKIEKSAFVTKYSPLNLLKETRHINTPAKAIEADNNSLSVYEKHLGTDAVSAVIELHLLSLNEAINVQQGLTVAQIKEIALEIMTLYYFINVVEIAYILRRAKRGEYGKFYGALSMPEILTWFEKYAEERAQLFINKQLDQRHNDHSMRSEDRKLWERHEKLVNKNKG